MGRGRTDRGSQPQSRFASFQRYPRPSKTAIPTTVLLRRDCTPFFFFGALSNIDKEIGVTHDIISHDVPAQHLDSPVDPTDMKQGTSRPSAVALTLDVRALCDDFFYTPPRPIRSLRRPIGVYHVHPLLQPTNTNACFSPAAVLVTQLFWIDIIVCLSCKAVHLSDVQTILYVFFSLLDPERI